jgi:acetyl esterase/lipase
LIKKEMKKLLLLWAMIGIVRLSQAQEVIPLAYEKNEAVTYEKAERKYYSTAWETTVVTNVSEPTLTVFQPSEDKKNGTAVIIAPGGGLYGLSINSEGVDVAQWLVARGVTAFVLKYRLVPSGEDGTTEISELMRKDPLALMKRVGEVLPFSVQDGLNAVSYVRGNAEKYNIDPQKIGFMGFSAGGAVTLGVGYQCNASNRPDFLAPIYPWTTAMPVQTPADNAPPVFIVCATNDGVGLAPGAVDLYKSYLEKGLSAELHMYSVGDHGFGMKVQGMPSDRWIERFFDWALVERFIAP